MNLRALFSCGATAALVMAAAQNPPASAVVVTRMIAAYRSLQSFSDEISIKRKVGSKESEARLTIASLRPNKFLCDLKGEGINTVIVSDGASLIAWRPERKVYTKSKAPQILSRADLIGKVEMPSIGARLIAQLLAGTARDGEFSAGLQAAKVSGPEALGNKFAFVLSFPMGEDSEV